MSTISLKILGGFIIGIMLGSIIFSTPIIKKHEYLVKASPGDEIRCEILNSSKPSIYFKAPK